jgi:mannosyl-3-phosphoglycerate phosphatase family protein
VKPLLLVFTDLDGSLLDHHSYSYQDALPQLHVLDRAGIPVIPASSKTRSEIARLRQALGNTHPFIVENGAAIWIPRDYFAQQPAQTRERDGYWVREMVAPRQHWLDLLKTVYADFAGEFDYFQRAGAAGIARMTGLSEEAAGEANQRDYSEPVHWLGSSERREEFLSRLRAAGAHPLQGGRFISVSGDCDKGAALAWLRGVYQGAFPDRTCHDIAIGDSRNDCAMLEAAETALLVRSTVHEFPALQRQQGVLRSQALGPAGWAEGVARWLHLYRKEMD